MQNSGVHSVSPQLGKSVYSSGYRRQILWNVVEPGDPYDIRKSMIAKLPGSHSYFMGDHLEILCLFQSAEIQRLCQFLEQYKFRYREMERKELDRHSYQVQIKQLTQQLSDDGSLRAENSKLKDFIKRQTMQIQEVKSNRFNADGNLRANYQSALSQIQTLLKDNNSLKLEKDNYTLQISNFSAKIQALQSARAREIRQLTSKYAQQNKFTIENQLRSIKTKNDSQISRLQFQIKRLKQFNDSKNQQITDLTLKNRNLLNQLQQLSNSKNQSHPAYISQMQQRFVLLGQQIQRLNLRIKQSTLRIDQSARNQIYWKDKFMRLEEDHKYQQQKLKQINNQYLKIKNKNDEVQGIASSSNKIKWLQEEVTQQKEELKRFQDQKLYEIQKYANLQKQYSELEYSSSKAIVIERENAQMKANMLNIQELQRKIAQYQPKIKSLTEQIERLNSQQKNSTIEKQGYNELKSQYEELKKISAQKQRNLIQRYQSQMERRVLEYQSKLSKCAEESGNQFEVRLQAINREVEKLNYYLKQKTQQSEQSKKRMKDLQNSIHQKYQGEVKKQYAKYESTIKELKVYVQQMNRKQRDYDCLIKQTAAYENGRALFTQQIQRLNYAINSKEEEIQNLKRKIWELERRPPVVTNLSMPVDHEVNRRMSAYEETQIQLARENEDLRRRLQEIVDLNRKVKQYEDIVRGFNQDNQRLKLVLKQKLDLLNRSQTNCRNLSVEIEVLRKNMKEVQLSYGQIRQFDKMQNSRKFVNYQQSLSSIQRQYDELRKKMMDFGNDNNRKASQYQNKIVILTQQIQRLNRVLKLKMGEYDSIITNQRNELQLAKRQNHDLKLSLSKKYQQQLSQKHHFYQQNINAINRQLQTFQKKSKQYQNILKLKSQQIIQLEYRYRVIAQQYQNFKFQVKHFQEDVNRSHNSYQQNLQLIVRENQDLKRIKLQCQNRISLILQDNQRLNVFIRSSQQQHETLRRTTNDIKTDLIQRYQLQSSRKNVVYEQAINTINRQKDQSKRKIIQYENIINNLNRQLENRNSKLFENQNRLRQIQGQIVQKNDIQSNHKMISYEQNIQILIKQLQAQKYKFSIHQQQKAHLEKQLKRLTNIIKQYESRFILIKQQLQRVNFNLKTKIDQLHHLENQFHHLYQEYQSFKKIYYHQQTNINNHNQHFDINQYQHNINVFKGQNEQLKKIILESQNKIQAKSQQIDKLTNTLKLKAHDLNQLQSQSKNWQQQLQISRRKILQLEKTTGQRFQSQHPKTANVYEQNIGTISKQYEELKRQVSKKVSQYQSKIVMLSQELEKSTQGSRLRAEQLEKAQRVIRDLQLNSTQRFDTEKVTIISSYEQSIASMTKQFEEYQLQATRKISERQRKIVELSKQSDNLKKQLKDKDNSFLIYQQNQLENSQKHSNNDVTMMRSQVDQYDRKMKQISNRYTENQSKLSKMAQEIQRLNETLKHALQQLAISQSQSKKYAAQLSVLKTAAQSQRSPQFNQLQTSYSLVNKQYQNSKKHLIQYQQSISKLYSQFERLQIIINELKNQRQTLFTKNNSLIAQIQRLSLQNKTQQTQIYQLRIDFTDKVSLQKRMNQHLALMVVLFAQIQALRQRIKIKQKEVQQIRRSSLAPLKAQMTFYQ